MVKNYRDYTIGVLALQGAVSEHAAGIAKLGAKAALVKRSDELKNLDALIIPGGESTAIGKLMARYDFVSPIKDFAAAGKAIFGTCAGMVLLAKNYTQHSAEPPVSLGLLDITVKRNAFGRQKESFEAAIDIEGFHKPFQAVFIRAPYAESAADMVEVLARLDGKIVCAKQDRILACSFHPELTDDDRLLRLFLDLI